MRDEPENLVLRPRLDFSFIDKQKDGLFDITPLYMESRKLLNASLMRFYALLQLMQSPRLTNTHQMFHLGLQRRQFL